MGNRIFREVKVYLRTVGLGGGLRAVWAKAQGATLFYKITRNDCKYPFHLRIPSTDIPTYRQVFIDREYDFSVKRKPQIIIDAGANIGLASIYMANRYPDAKIIAIEPEKSNFELLKENLAPYSNATPVQAALWHRNEEINLIDPGLGKWGFMTETKDPSETTSRKARHTVTATTVDQIIKDFGISKIDILKMDIEGAEKEVFSDTSAWIERVDSIIIELHEHLKPGCHRSFYSGSMGFNTEWKQGENIYLSRGNILKHQKTMDDSSSSNRAKN